MKRSSRNIVLSKAMRYVDEETRREYRERRLQSLECDNYTESDLTGQADGNDGDEYDEEGERSPGPKAKKKRLTAAAAQKSSSSSQWAGRAVKPLERLLLDNGIVPSSAKSSSNVEVNYYSIMAKPSIYPPRQNFCSVCGYLSNYCCLRCGAKYCSIKCNEHHKETKCFKVSM
jgi:zinc finger HIT domain-containing protein 1